MVKNLPANAGYVGDAGSIPELGRFSGEGKGNPLKFLPEKCHGQRSLVGCIDHGVAKSQMQLSD